MIRWLLIATALLVAAMPVAAQEPQPDGVHDVRILVTFFDAGLRRAAPTGPPGPGYRRRSSPYVPSIGVRQAARRLAVDFDLQPLDEWPIQSLNVHCLVFGVAEGVDVEALLAGLRERPEVESAQRLNSFELSATPAPGFDDPYAALQYVLDTLQIPQAHAWSTGAGTEITIIDTGADLEHPDLEAQIAAHHDFSAAGPDAFTTDTHGTAVAGIIAAAAGNGIGMIGVAPESRLTVLKACWYPEGGSAAVCDSFTLAKALEQVIGSSADVVNLSLTGPSDPLLSRLLGIVIEQGVSVVAAATTPAEAGFPAEVAGVIVAGSVADPGPPGDRRGRQVSAPGTDILVPAPAGGYDYASGSSLAAAHVSGVVALLLSRRPDLGLDEIATLLIDSQSTLSRSVNACRALADLLGESGCVPRETVSQSLRQGVVTSRATGSIPVANPRRFR